jgi:hypothetical protein
MNEQRAFTVVVTGCHNCYKAVRKDMQSTIKVCSDATYFQAEKVHIDNYTTITPTCPMFEKSKII